MTKDRSEAIHRQRRIILNDDNGSILGEDAGSVEKYLADPIAYTVDTQVDSIWLSVIVGADDLTYPTEVGEMAGRDPYPGAPKAVRERKARIWRNMKALLDAGTDPLKAAVDFGHSHGKEVFASFRMNMIQDSWQRDFSSKWKREHPECCLGVRGMYEYCDRDDPRHLFWSGLDYEQQEVRDHRMAVLDEICSGFDVDGLELDFWRWPMFFKPSLDNLPVQPRHIEIMTGFVRRLRERMLEIEAGRGRPLLLAPRVFETIEANLKLGLDVETWLEEGLIDLLVVGGTYHEHAIPVAEWAELAHGHDVPLYPCKYRSYGMEEDRSVAANFFSQGADGIYTFNFRMPQGLEPAKEIGDPELIATKDKHYAMPLPQTDVAFGRGCAPELLPVELAEGVPRHAALIIGDDVQQAALDDTLQELKLSLTLRHFTPERDEVTFTVNGRKLRNPRRTEDVHRSLRKERDVCRLEFTLYTIYTDVRREPPVSQGRNTIEATLVRRGTGEREPVDLVGVELSVCYQ